jgi:hypothetical protein
MNRSASRDPLDGDDTPTDPARIGSGLIGGEAGESAAPRSVTSMDAPPVHRPTNEEDDE